jgi:hypothetical protein
MATPADLPLKRYLALQIKTDREVLDLLRSIKRDVDASLRSLEGSTKAGAVVRREQLRLAQHAIDDAVNAAWIRLADVIEKGALVGARDAVLVNGEFDRALTSAGLSGAQRAALLDSNIVQSQQAVRHALNRHLDTTGATRIPLSEKVYKSRNLVKGEVDRMVESALARGLSAKEFAAEIRQFINPNTPGGVRYAAMRLSRTEINNAFHFAQTRDNAMKPWVDGQKWYLSGSHPKPDECNDFAEQNRFDLGVGVFPKDDVPNKPHPHCLCYITPETVSEEEWLRKFQKGEYNDYIDSRMPVGLPQNTKTDMFATRAQAKAFVKNSKFKDPMSHVSNEKNAESIAKQGLKSGEGQAAGIKYGRGVYVATDEMTTAAYERAAGVSGLEKGKTITYDVYVRVRNPFDVDVSIARIKSMLKDETRGIDQVVTELTDDKEGLERFRQKYLKQFREWQDMALSDKFFGKSEELLEKATRDRFGVSVADIQRPRESALRAFLESKGFDSIHIHGLKKFDAKIGGNQILVFNDKNVLITNPVARRGK